VSSPAERAVDVVAIGASAGGVHAISALLKALPAVFTPAVLIVVHLPPVNDSHLSELFGRLCPCPVKEAEEKEKIVPGTVYIAPPGYHLLVEQDGTFSLSVEEPVNFSRPSIDVLFETAADAYGARLAGVVLSGANEDGARGLQYIAEAGGIAFVQDPEEAEVATMPGEALRRVPSAEVLTLSKLAERIAGLA
jgi:two-component system chemotaxis response regulator CheB